MAKDRLYYSDSRLWEFQADVVSCEKTPAHEDGTILWKAKLSPNAFYPESGGQPSDRGQVAGVPVVDVVEEDDGSVSVVLEGPIHDRVSCRVDGARRFDLMQQHTGQHILSAAFEKLYGYETVGFHLGEEYCTVDLDTEKLDEVDADRAEDMANAVVFSDVSVSSEFVGPERLADFSLRKLPKVDKDIRIVSVADFDNCPCGGTHVSRTGEIGIIKITRIDRAKGKVRIEILCGDRALRDYRGKNRQLLRSASSLSVHPSELETQIDRILTQLKEAKKALAEAAAGLMEYESAKIWNETELLRGVKVIAHDAGSGSMDFAKQFALKLVAHPATVAIIGATSSGNAYLVVARSPELKVDASAAFKAAAVLIEGKGGGNSGMAQGGGPKAQSLAQALEAAQASVAAQLE